MVGVANPKTIVLFIVALPEFTSRAPGHLPVQAQMLILGALFLGWSRSCWTACGRPAPAAARQWFASSPGRLALIGSAAWAW